MPYIVIPQPFPKSPLQTQFDTEDEANARAQSMIEQAPQQAVYVAELKTLYQGKLLSPQPLRLLSPRTPSRDSFTATPGGVATTCRIVETTTRKHKPPGFALAPIHVSPPMCGLLHFWRPA